MTRITPFGEIEVCDAHCHFFSHNFFQTLIGQSPSLSQDPNPIARVVELTGWVMPSPQPTNLGAVWKAELDLHAVSAAMLIASVPADEVSVATAVAASPDRFAGAFMLDPTKPDAEERTRRAFKELRLRVVCLFPAMHQYSVAECEGARAVAALAAEYPGTAVFVHCGALSVGVRKKLGLKSPFDMRRSNPLDIYKLATEFPATNFIVPHFGAGMFRETMMLADLCPNVFIDTSSSNKWMNYEASPVDLATVFKRALTVVGHERLLFGTDSSFFPRGWQAGIFQAQVNALVEIGVSGEQAQAILGGNLRRLLGL
ncbi:MAG TPA: amidohydrolase family protein [Blastocatellia bacterium]|nr:amidohydrolase family protein [Blastocatellia bacterium]HMX30032.1 amidohydrolase family protein [Blastocatellia bacterium]HMY74601.1 amidohydrolase family protein [Blastocatellia bacterium]HMZ16750.1 amidohydrolase family protein [Blastocatellia bacterium]HNG28252.1 amidohydrolase family protein [Blastocatellia bacterium]